MKWTMFYPPTYDLLIFHTNEQFWRDYALNISDFRCSGKRGICFVCNQDNIWRIPFPCILILFHSFRSQSWHRKLICAWCYYRGLLRLNEYINGHSERDRGLVNLLINNNYIIVENFCKPTKVDIRVSRMVWCFE